MRKDNVFVITGPTASGKSEIAIDFAINKGGEIICADSMQIYSDMDIGTAKTMPEEQKQIPHHMTDIITPEETFSVAAYKERAVKTINEIISRDNVPVICGGTGQYISALVEGIEFIDIPTDFELRKNLENEYDIKGPEYFYSLLKKIDPETAKNTHPNDKKRVIRGIEIHHLTGLNKTEINKRSREKGPDFNYKMHCITPDMDGLYKRINERVDDMIKSGLVSEVEYILDKYPDISKTARQAIGYKEIIQFLNKKCTLEEAVDKIKQSTRNYAKRQMTWIRGNGWDNNKIF